MGVGLLRTKFFRPLPGKVWLEREALFERLNQNLQSDRILTLVSAPAGYGKSTLVNTWLTQQSLSASWLTLDDKDNELGRFLMYLIASIQQVEPDFCGDLFTVLQADQVPPPDVLVTTLVEDMLKWTQKRIVVLDDFHCIHNPAVLDVLNHLLISQPPLLHLMILTREDPPLPLARLRVGGQMSEIRTLDLRFSSDESRQFFQKVIGIDLPQPDIQSLTSRTEGWAAGLQLAGLILRDLKDPSTFIRAFSGGHRFILSYLTEEVLNHQTAEVQDFLLQTSILSQLCGELCDAVTGRTDSAEQLETLYSANLFLILLDESDGWYRYHPLFAEMLQSQLRRRAPHLIAELHRRASGWFEEQDMPVYSIEHALVAGRDASLVGLLEKHSWQLLTRGYSQRFIMWVEELPPELRRLSPILNTSLVWGKILHGEYPQAASDLIEAQEALENLSPEHPKRQIIEAELLALQSFIAQARGEVEEALALAEKAKSLVPPEEIRMKGSTALAYGVACRMLGRFEEAIESLNEAIQFGHELEDHITAMVAVAHLSLIFLRLGELHRLAAVAEVAIERAEKISRVAPLMIGYAHAALGEVYYEWGEVEKARSILSHAIRLATLANHPASLIYSKIAMARLCQGEGDLEAAEQSLAEAYEILAHAGPAWAYLDWVAQQVSLLVAQGKLQQAENLLISTKIIPESEVTYRTEGIHLAWLRWMIAHRHPEALDLAERIVKEASAGKRNGTLLRALVLGAKAGGGVEWLKQAKTLAAAEGYQRIFLDEGCELISTSSSELVEPLSERELEVLRLLAQGLTYTEIAQSLFVSINTVRHHIKNIYSKLGVEKQTQAVQRARELKLI